MSWSNLEKNALKAFDRANPNLIDCNLDDLDNNFKYLFLTLPLPVYSIDWRRTNNLLAIINKDQQEGDLLSNSMSIFNDPLAEIAIQDIVNADSVKATQISFNTLFDTESMVNFYVIGSSSPLACHHSEEHKNSNIEDGISQPQDDLAPGQKWEIIRHVKSREPH